MKPRLSRGFCLAREFPMRLGEGDERSDDQGHHTHQLDEDVERRSRCVLEGITHGVADDGGVVHVGALAVDLAVLGAEAVLDGLLRIVPRTTGVGHEDGHAHTGDCDTSQQTGESLRIPEADHDGYDDGHEARHHHTLDGSLGGDIHTASVVGLDAFLAFAQTGNLAELTPHFHDHFHRRFADGLHGHGGEKEGQHTTDEQACHGGGLGDVDDVDVGLGAVRGEQGQGGQRRGADGETLADGGSGVAHGVELVSALTDLGSLTGHLGDAASVVGHGTIGVHSQLDAGG